MPDSAGTTALQHARVAAPQQRLERRHRRRRADRAEHVRELALHPPFAIVEMVADLRE